MYANSLYQMLYGYTMADPVCVCVWLSPWITFVLEKKMKLPGIDPGASRMLSARFAGVGARLSSPRLLLLVTR
jgi:hypothetical protein